MTPARGVLAALMVLLALVLQTSVLPLLVGGTALPNLCLLVVVAAGLSAGETAGTVTGFAAGMALDLIPPADHLAGRWALALAVAGFLAGHLAVHQPEHAARTRPTRRNRAESLVRVALVTAAASFVATSIFALSGLVFGELAWGVPELLRGVGVAVGLDVVAGACWCRCCSGRWSRTRSPSRCWAEPDDRAAGASDRCDRREADPAPRAGDPGPGLLAGGHAARSSLLPPGGRGRELPGPGRLPVGARHRAAARARPDRRRAGPAAGGQPGRLGGLGRPHHARTARTARAGTGCCAGWPPRSAYPRGGSRPAWSTAAATAPGPGCAGTARPTSRCRWPRTCRRTSRCGCSSSRRTIPPCWPSSRACAPTRRRTASTSPTSWATSAR